MKTLDTNKTALSNTTFTLSGKFWRGLKRYKDRDDGLRKYLSRSKSLIGRKDLEVEYGLGPGEALGV